MIPNKLLLRAATIMALTRGGGDGPYPTMAGAQVFDTKLKPITDLAQESMTPVVLVYTDADTRTNKDPNTKRSWKRNVALVIELALGSIGANGIEYAEADSELEALMDLFELEVETALQNPACPWAQHWSRLIKTIDQWEVTPFRSAEQSRRYAVRQILISCTIDTECAPQPTIGRPHVTKTIDENGAFIPGSLLPVPYLAPFEAAMLATEPVFESTRQLLTGAAHQPLVPALRSVFIKGDFIDPADPNRLPPGQTQGPDGRIEVEAHIEDLHK